MELVHDFWWLIPATFFTAVLTAVSGAGGGTLLLALIALALPPGAVIPVHGAVQGVQNLIRLPMLWRYIDWSFVAAAWVGTLLGAAVMGPVAVNMPPVLAELVLGVGLLYLVWAPKMKGEINFPGKTIVLATVVSMIAMVIGAAGTLFNAVRKRGGRAKEGVLADQSAVFIVQHILKVMIFGLFGFAFAPYVPLMAGMMAMSIVGSIAGVTMMKRMDNALFDKIFKVVITALACKMLYDALLIYGAGGVGAG